MSGIKAQGPGLAHVLKVELGAAQFLDISSTDHK